MNEKTFPTDAAKMREVGKSISEQLPGKGYALLVFDFGPETGPANYISNAQRSDMIKFLRETLDRFERQEDFRTPEPN